MARDLMMSNMPVTNGLICWLDGRDGSGTQTTWIDRSGNGNNATLLNFTFDSTNGWINNFLRTGNMKGYIKLCNIPTVFSIYIFCEFKGVATAAYQRLVTIGIDSTFSNQIGIQVGTTEYNGIRCFNQLLSNILTIEPSYLSNLDICIRFDNSKSNANFTSISKNVNYSNITSKVLTDPLTYNYLNYESGTYYGRDVCYKSVLIYNRYLTEEEILQNYDYEKSIVRT